jgi:hypothetical protein
MLGLLSLLSTSAEAFCGTYVGGVGAELYNEYSQLAVVRDGNSTTLTIVNDVQGNFDSFALVIPVPEVIAEDKINVLDPTLFDRLDAYSQPRLVEYSCADFEVDNDTGWAFDSATEDGSVPSNGGSEVNVEALYIVGEFEIVILSATESGALFTWLNDNGYQVPGQSQTLLQEYISAGSYFLAAKVQADAGVEPGQTLSPLQFAYTSPSFQIPIRIGTLNSKEAQDLIIYSVSPYQQGRVGISNYPEFSIEDECMWDSQGETFGEYYTKKFKEGYESKEDAAWTVEYAWGGGGCDPCSGNPPDASDLVALGLNEEYVHYSDYFFTRLHARYTPQQATEELMLYPSNITSNDQYRFIQYLYELEDRFPICGEGMAEDPGTCDGIVDNTDTDTPNNEDTSNMTTTTNDGCGGCSTGTGGMALAMWFVGLWTGLRRRR